MLEITGCPGRRLIVCESVFSMDGDLAPLAGLRDLATCYDATLLVDDAHAIGVFGSGGGLVYPLRATCDSESLLTLGTLSKALGSLGGFVASGCEMREYLLNRTPQLYLCHRASAAQRRGGFGRSGVHCRRFRRWASGS